MATKTEDKNTGSKSGSAAKRKARQRNRIIIFAVEVVIILAMLVGVFLVFRTTQNSQGPNITSLNPDDLGINPGVAAKPQDKQEAEGSISPEDVGSITTGPMENYWNIALFGVDATTESQLYKGSRSDATMIASINKETGDIKLVSVYRDTFLNINNDSKYRKANQAYADGGAKQAISMLNSNLDMNITDFVAVNYKGLASVVDGLGGIWIDVDKTELQHINNYQKTIVKDVKNMKDYPMVEVKQTGYQLLDGLQASSYCRIRYGGGDDFKRTERQREVLKAIEEQAKKASLTTLTSVFTNSLEYIYTSLDQDDILAMLGKISDYRIAQEGGFPEQSMRGTGTIGATGSCVIPLNLEKNVVWLHEFLFEDADYQVTPEVKSYSDYIASYTRPYMDAFNAREE